MKWLLPLALTGAALGGVLAWPSHAAAPAGPSSAGGTAGPVLVELFTSEGCSSCPPADGVLAELAGRADVVVLAHHVDYWDRLGWVDPFSSPAATARQRARGGSYTPQAVVDGERELVGSRKGALLDAIAEAARRPHAPVTLTVTPGAAGLLVAVTGPAGAVRRLAIVQDRARVVVPRGENAGHVLAHVAIVRELRRLDGATTTVTLPAPVAAPEGTTFSLVAIAEDETAHVLGTARVTLGH